ncbi:MAG TPA: hypothetical protein VNZ03_30195 [Terriglobales bacterium]|nr:hypothetical protein [Terriglobales bacterium]
MKSCSQGKYFPTGLGLAQSDTGVCIASGAFLVWGIDDLVALCMQMSLLATDGRNNPTCERLGH